MMEDTLKTIGTSTGTLMVNFWNLVPDILGLVLFVMNILYVYYKIQKVK